MSRKGVRGKEEAQASFPRSRPFFCGGVGAVFFRPKEKRLHNSHLCYDEIVHITKPSWLAGRRRRLMTAISGALKV